MWNQPLHRVDDVAGLRQVVHDVVADAGLVSASEGEDPSRRVVVHPVPA